MLYTNIQYVYSLLSHYNKRHRDKLWASLCLGQLWHIRTWLSRASGGLVWYQFGLEWGSGKFLGRISGLGHFACLAPCMAGCDVLFVLLFFIVASIYSFLRFVLHWLFCGIGPEGLAFGFGGPGFALGAYDPLTSLLVYS